MPVKGAKMKSREGGHHAVIKQHWISLKGNCCELKDEFFFNEQ